MPAVDGDVADLVLGLQKLDALERLVEERDAAEEVRHGEENPRRRDVEMRGPLVLERHLALPVASQVEREEHVGRGRDDEVLGPAGREGRLPPAHLHLLGGLRALAVESPQARFVVEGTATCLAPRVTAICPPREPPSVLKTRVRQSVAGPPASSSRSPAPNSR